MCCIVNKKVKTKMDYLREIIYNECAGAEPHSVSPKQINAKLKAMGINVDSSNISAEMKKMGFPFKKQTVAQTARQSLVRSETESFHKNIRGGLEDYNKKKSEEPKVEKPKVQVQIKEKPVSKNLEILKSRTYICISTIEQGGFEYVR